MKLEDWPQNKFDDDTVIVQNCDFKNSVPYRVVTCFLAIQVNFSFNVEQKAWTATYNCFHTSKFRYVKLWTNRNLLRNFERTSFMSNAYYWQLQITNSTNQTK